MLKLFPFIFATALLLVSGCNKKNKDDGFNRAAMLTNIGNYIIAPAHQQLSTATASLNEKTLAFTTNPDLATLLELTDAYEVAYLAFMEVEVYAIGPSEELRVALNSFPADTAQVNSNAILVPGSYNLNSAANARAKGFPAIDFLLYSDNASSTVSLFSTAPGAANRRAYLEAIVAEINTKTATANSGWGSYLSTFISADGTDIGGSTGILANEISYTSERGRRERVGNALGYIGLINSGTKNAGLVEAFHSKLSKELLIKNIQSLKQLYTGGTGIGFDDYLEHVGTEIDGQPAATAIGNQFDIVLQKAAAVPTDLGTAVNSNNAEMEALFLELKKLTVFLKVEMSSQLGLTINYSDNDGD